MFKVNSLFKSISPLIFKMPFIWRLDIEKIVALFPRFIVGSFENISVRPLYSKNSEKNKSGLGLSFRHSRIFVVTEDILVDNNEHPRKDIS